MSSLDHLKALVKFAKQSKDPDLLEHVITLQEHVLELQEQLRSLEKEISEKDTQIAELEKALAFSKDLTRYKDAYYFFDESGELIKGPYCSHCWEVKNQPIHLHRSPRDHRRRHCPACKNDYQADLTPNIEEIRRD